MNDFEIQQKDIAIIHDDTCTYSINVNNLEAHLPDGIQHLFFIMHTDKTSCECLIFYCLIEG